MASRRPSDGRAQTKLERHWRTGDWRFLRPVRCVKCGLAVPTSGTLSGMTNRYRPIRFAGAVTMPSTFVSIGQPIGNAFFQGFGRTFGCNTSRLIPALATGHLLKPIPSAWRRSLHSVALRELWSCAALKFSADLLWCSRQATCSERYYCEARRRSQRKVSDCSRPKTEL